MLENLEIEILRVLIAAGFSGITFIAKRIWV